jgi:hypothetical protein
MTKVKWTSPTREIRVWALRFSWRMFGWLTWDRAGPLGENGGSSVGKGKESDVASWDLQRGSPCLCQLRTDGLAPAENYWTYWSHTRVMGPVNWCSMFINRCLTFIAALMAIRGEKLGGGPMDWSFDVLGIVLGALFLGSSKVYPTLLGQCERLPHMTCHWWVRVVYIRFLL